MEKADPKCLTHTLNVMGL